MKHRRRLIQTIGVFYAVVLPLGLFFYLNSQEVVNGFTYVFYALVLLSVFVGTKFLQRMNQYCPKCGDQMVIQKEELQSTRDVLRSKKPRVRQIFKQTVVCKRCNHTEHITVSKEKMK